VRDVARELPYTETTATVAAMAEPGAGEITARPDVGRVFEGGRRVRLGDVDATGRCRLDAAVRYLQDVARDDSADADLTDPMNWVVRRVMLEVHVPPVFEEWVDVATWCSGHGSRWAERRTSLHGEDGAHLEGVTIWIYVDGETGRPKALNSDFFDIYGPTAADRRVSARQSLSTSPIDGATTEPWPLRFTDFDVLGHVNNAAQWGAVEEVVSRVDGPRQGIRAELEHGPGIEPGDETQLRWSAAEGGIHAWLMANGKAGSVARVRPL